MKLQFRRRRDSLDILMKARAAILTRDDDARGVTDLALSVPGDAGVIANVLVLDRRDPELGAVVEYTDGRRRLHGIRVLVPKDLGRRSTLSLAVEYYRIAQIHVYHIIRRYAESGWRCEQWGCDCRRLDTVCVCVCVASLRIRDLNSIVGYFRGGTERYRDFPSVSTLGLIERTRLVFPNRIIPFAPYASRLPVIFPTHRRRLPGEKRQEKRARSSRAEMLLFALRGRRWRCACRRTSATENGREETTLEGKGKSGNNQARVASVDGSENVP